MCCRSAANNLYRATTNYRVRGLVAVRHLHVSRWPSTGAVADRQTLAKSRLTSCVLTPLTVSLVGLCTTFELNNCCKGVNLNIHFIGICEASRFDSNSNINARFDSRFDSNANSRFAGPYIHISRGSTEKKLLCRSGEFCTIFLRSSSMTATVKKY